MNMIWYLSRKVLLKNSDKKIQKQRKNALDLTQV